MTTATTRSRATATAPGAGLIAGQGGIPTATVRVDTTAIVPSTATLTATGHINLSALSSNKADATVLAVAVGAVGVGISLATATVRDTTQARLDGRVTSGASVTVRAEGNEHADAEATAASGGVIAGSAAEAMAHVVQNDAGDVTLQASIGSRGVNVTGDIRVDAKLIASSKADAIGVAISLVGSIDGITDVGGGGTIADAQLRPVVRSFIDGGTVTSTAGGIGVSARYNATESGVRIGAAHSTEADALGVAASAFIGVGGATATARDAGNVRAYVSSGATLSGGGALASGPSVGKGIAVLVSSYSAPDASTTGVSAGGLFASGGSTATALFDGTSLAFLDGGVTAGASLAIVAFGTAKVDASAFGLAGGLIASGDGVVAHAKVLPGAASDPTLRASTGTGSITVTGAISLSSVLISTAEADATGVQISAVGVGGRGGKADAQAILDTDIQTCIGGGSATSTAGGISLTSRYNANTSGGNVSGVTNTVDADALAVAASLFFGNGGAFATAHDHGIVNTYVGAGATLSAGGPISLLSTSYSTPKAVTDGLSFSLAVAKGASQADALFDGATRAHQDGGVTAGGDLGVTSIATAHTDADATALGGGLLFGNTAGTANAKVQPGLGGQPVVQATLGSRDVTVNGDIDLASTLHASADATWSSCSPAAVSWRLTPPGAKRSRIFHGGRGSLKASTHRLRS